MKGLRITRCSQLKVGVKWNRRSPGGHRRHNCKISFLWTGMLFHCSICITVWLKKYALLTNWGQDGWILAKFLCVFFVDHGKVAFHKNLKKKRTRHLVQSSSHLNQTSLVNKGCIIERAVYVFSVLTIYCKLQI